MDDWLGVDLPSEKYEFVSWDDFSYMENKIHVWNHQPGQNTTYYSMNSMYSY